MNDALQIVKDFYETSWNHLIWFVGVIGGIVAIAVPVVIQFVQSRRFKVEETNLAKRLSSDNENAIQKAVSEATRELRVTLMKELKEQVAVAVEDIRKQSKIAMGAIMQVQGAASLERRDFYQASIDFISAIEYFLEANDEYSYRGAVDVLKRKCMNNLDKKVFETHADTEPYFTEFIDGLMNEGDFRSQFHRDAVELRTILSEVRHKEPPST